MTEKISENRAGDPRNSLTLHFLGTGAADHDWSDPAHPADRGSTSTLLNGMVLIDAGTTGFENFRRAGAGMAGLTDIVFTHTHRDHFQPNVVARILAERDRELPPLGIWVTPGGAGRLAAPLKGLNCVIHPIRHGDAFTAGGLRFTALLSNHRVEDPEEETFWFLIAAPQGDLLYALDGAWMTPGAAAALLDRHLSWIVWDGTMEKAGDWRIFEHSDMEMITSEIVGLRKRGSVDDRTVHILSHIARTLWSPEPAATEHAKEKGFILAQDGMKIIFSGDGSFTVA